MHFPNASTKIAYKMDILTATYEKISSRRAPPQHTPMASTAKQPAFFMGRYKEHDCYITYEVQDGSAGTIKVVAKSGNDSSEVASTDNLAGYFFQLQNYPMKFQEITPLLMCAIYFDLLTVVDDGFKWSSRLDQYANSGIINLDDFFLDADLVVRVPLCYLKSAAVYTASLANPKKIDINKLIRNYGWKLGSYGGRYGGGVLVALVPMSADPLKMLDDYACGGDEDWNLFCQVCDDNPWFPAFRADSFEEGLKKIQGVIDQVFIKAPGENPEDSLSKWTDAVYWVWRYASEAWDEHIYCVDEIGDKLRALGEWNIDVFDGGNFNPFLCEGKPTLEVLMSDLYPLISDKKFEKAFKVVEQIDAKWKGRVTQRDHYLKMRNEVVEGIKKIKEV